MTDESTRSVEIPEPLFERLSAAISGTRYKTVSAYIVDILREQVAKQEEQKTTGYSKEEEEKIKSRLRALGYLEYSRRLVNRYVGSARR